MNGNCHPEREAVKGLVGVILRLLRAQDERALR